jgi:hypothetical protein
MASLKPREMFVVAVVLIGVLIAWTRAVQHIEAQVDMKETFYEMDKEDKTKTNNDLSNIVAEPVNAYLEEIKHNFSDEQYKVLLNHATEVLHREKQKLTSLPSLQEQELMRRTVDSEVKSKIQALLIEIDGVGSVSDDIMQRSAGWPSPSLSHDMLYLMEKEIRGDPSWSEKVTPLRDPQTVQAHAGSI